MRIHTIPRGVMPPLPAMIKGDVDKVLQGGMPPVPYRARNDWNGAAKRARSDGTSTACRGECFHSTSEWNGVKFVAP